MEEIDILNQQAPLCNAVTEVDADFRGGSMKESCWVSHKDVLQKYMIPLESFSPLLIAETFESIQGEGREMGHFSFFIRAALCNLNCVACDSAWAKRKKTNHPLIKFEELVDQIVNSDQNHVTVTGGEPLLQAHQLALVLFLAKGALLKNNRILFVELETNGTIIPPPFLVALTDCFNVSPKLSNFGAENHEVAHKMYRKSMSVWRALAKQNRVYFKFVIRGTVDMPEVKEFVKSFQLPREKCYLMPFGAKKHDILNIYREVVDCCREHRFNFSSRMHILAYGNRKGV